MKYALAGLFVLVAANLYITYRIADGLQGAQDSFAKVTDGPLGKLLGNIFK